jgi:hypothetical protein
MQKGTLMRALGLATLWVLVAMEAQAGDAAVAEIPLPLGNNTTAVAAGDQPADDPPVVSPSGRSLGPVLPQGLFSTPSAAASAPGSPYGGGRLSYVVSGPFYGIRPPPQPWKGVFFENDFSFLRDPDHVYVVGERLKDLDVRALTIGTMRTPDLECDDPSNVEIREFLPLAYLPDPTRISYGGEVRFRQMDEANRLRPGAPARGDYQLWRWRQYLDLKVADWLRVYVEGIDASMDNNPLPVTGIDINRWDVQNLFLDLRLWTFDDDDDRPVWFRVGRQELQYGSQRLLSAFDWANVRRNFEGLKLFTRGADWDFDLWFTRPVNTGTFGDGPVSVFGSHFDSPNMNHTFSGTWFTYKELKDHLFDLYWLWDWNSQFLGPHFAGGNRHTIASRWIGNFPVLDGAFKGAWHGEVEGGYQFGNDFGKVVSAGFLTAGMGHTWDDAPWRPDLWVYYDWASGSNNLNGKTTSTFNQQYGLNHYYLGQIDNIARQNIIDINTRLTVQPRRQLAFQTWYHWFMLQNSHDVLYTVTGVPFGKPNTGSTVGDELDLVATYTFNPNFNVQVGYMWFWYGTFVENNFPREKAEQLYVQTTLSY